MVQVCCRLVNSFDTDLTQSGNVPGLISVSVQPSTSISQSTGTITISAFSFDATTGPYLGVYCGDFSIDAQISWLIKRNCGPWEDTPMTVPPPSGDTKLVFIPQITSPVTLRTPDDATLTDGDSLFPNPVAGLTLEGYDILNQAGPVNSLQADASSGPQNNYIVSNTWFMRYIKFIALHPVFNFNTYDNTEGNLDDPVVLTIEGETYEAYPQSFNLTVQPPRPAIVNITYVFEDTGIKPLEITNCDIPD